jgi:hypothetical protein
MHPKVQGNRTSAASRSSVGSVASFPLREVPLCCSTEREGEEGGMMDVKGSPFEKDIIWWGVRWSVASPIAYRQ